MNAKVDVLQNLAQEAMSDGSISPQALQALIEKIKQTRVHILLVGATGAGKSSTINALFNTQHAKVGTGTDPETKEITQYELDNITLWDTPGLGESPDADKRHISSLRAKLSEKDANNNLLIDLVLLIVDGSNRDMSSTFTLLEEVIIPGLGKEKDRLLVAINQADLAMKGKYWDHQLNQPQEPLVRFLEDKVGSIKKRILESKGISISPIYYSAGNLDDNGTQKPYNLAKLMTFILEHVKAKKRLVFLQDINDKKENFESNDNTNYGEKIEAIFTDSWLKNIGDFLAETAKTAAGVIKEVVTSPAVTNALTKALLKLIKLK